MSPGMRGLAAGQSRFQRLHVLFLNRLQTRNRFRKGRLAKVSAQLQRDGLHITHTLNLRPIRSRLARHAAKRSGERAPGVGRGSTRPSRFPQFLKFKPEELVQV